jgi:c-di-GMP-related signal transduction protein
MFKNVEFMKSSLDRAEITLHLLKKRSPQAPVQQVVSGMASVRGLGTKGICGTTGTN